MVERLDIEVVEYVQKDVVEYQKVPIIKEEIVYEKTKKPKKKIYQ